ncbi:T9SS type A sorting domain-containing protein [Candidatus Dojkabacteria bacterium]|nr:T9SS type A sorting domain-containing protein [Candidatus Dojkabacteria bacterium]
MLNKFVIFILFLLISFSGISQIITNNGAKVDIKSGTRVMFHTLHNMGSGGEFNYNTSLSLPGNWINDSPAAFQHGATGTVTLNGTTQQTVKSSSHDFGDLTINNTSGNNQAIVLSDNMYIETKLNLTQGIVYTGTNKFIFLDGSTSSSPGNANSFIDGTIEKIGNTDFIFPAGDVNLRDIGAGLITYKVWSPLEINPNALTTIDVKYVYDNVGMPDWWEHGGNMDETLHHVSDREYWLVSSTQNFIKSTLYWNNNGHAIEQPCVHGFDLGNPATFNPGDLTVAYWNGNKWINAGSGLPQLLVHDDGYISTIDVIPFISMSETYITYGSLKNDNSLPVELINLSAECIINKIEIIWQTASEINNDKFIIEKSKDSENFYQIGFIQGAGNSNNILTYTFIDNNTYDNNYYRLKQIDYDGKITYSNIINAFCYDNTQNKPIINIYPNPTKNSINIEGEDLPDNDIQIEIYNVINELIWFKLENINNGHINIVYDMTNLPPAMYIVKITSNNFINTHKVEKQ